MGWVSPTGHNDPGDDWNVEERAYDNVLGAGHVAGSDTDGSGWTDFLELTHASLNINKIRYFHTLFAGHGIDNIDIDVYYSLDWHHVYEGAIVSGEWVEKAIVASGVTAARIRLDQPAGQVEPHFDEFDFGEAPPVVGRSFGFIFG